MENQEIQYTKGFNSGYLMAKHQPELKRKITKSLEGESDYTKGFLSGSNQFEIERTNELARVRTRGKEKKRDLRRNL